MKQRKRLSAIIALILAVLMVLGLLSSALIMTASAARSDALKKKLDELQERADANDELKNDVQDKLDKNYDQIQELVQKKQEIDERINGTHAQINELNERIQEYNLTIAAKQQELDDREATRQELNEKYKKRIRAMEETGKVSYWSVLFNATSFGDLLSRIDMINEIVVADQLMLEQLQKVVEQIEVDRKELEIDKQYLEDAKQELAGLEEELEAQRAESDRYIVQINKDIGILNALFLEYDNIADELQEEIDDVRTEYNAEKAKEAEEARKKLAAQQAAAARVVSSSSSSTSTVSASGFQFPLPAGLGTSITDSYGYRWHPINGNYSFHQGVDFAVGSGTSILASKAGTVSVAGYGTVNGNYIKLQHADGSMTYYLHMNSFAVSQGDYVSQGQKIGTVGSTGSSTGPHLHFQIMVNGASVNPMDYVSLQ